MSTWLTSPLETDNGSGNLVLATVRKDVRKFMDNPRYRYRVEVAWNYTPAAAGMPSEADSELMERVQEAVEKTLAKDPVAVLTGVYTGDGVRDLVFYTLSLHIFQRKFNEILEPFPLLPLEFSAEEDPGWEEYRTMLAITSASDTDDDDTLSDDTSDTDPSLGDC